MTQGETDSKAHFSSFLLYIHIFTRGSCPVKPWSSDIDCAVDFPADICTAVTNEGQTVSKETCRKRTLCLFAFTHLHPAQKQNQLSQANK